MAKTKIMLEKRLTVPTFIKALVPVIAIFLALIATSVFFIAGGKNPIEMYLDKHFYQLSYNILVASFATQNSEIS